MTGWVTDGWNYVVALPQQPSPTEETTVSDASAEEVPVDIVVQTGEKDVCAQHWMTPLPPSDLPEPPETMNSSNVGDDWSIWAQQVDGVPISSDVVVIVQGRTDAEVTITNIRFDVRRAVAFPGTYAYVHCELTEGPVRKISVDLDRNPPEVHAFDTRDMLEGAAPREIRFPYNLRISETESETFLLTPYTDSCDCTWTAQLDWVSQGNSGSLSINDNGAPFRITTTALANWTCKSLYGSGPWDCK